MSRIAKKPIPIPPNTTVSLNGYLIEVKGPNGTLLRKYDGSSVEISIQANEIVLKRIKNDLQSKALIGTYASHLKNMIKGVNTLFEKKLIIEGIGYKSDVKGDSLNMSLGFSHPVNVKIPKTLTVTSDKNAITVKGADKDLVGEFSARVRNFKKPEPYKGKGIRYSDEVIRRKQGKKAV